MSIFFCANILFFIASIPMMREVVKNKNTLCGYSRSGARLTVIGMMLMVVGFLHINDIYTVAIMLPTIVFWGAAAYYAR